MHPRARDERMSFEHLSARLLVPVWCGNLTIEVKKKCGNFTIFELILDSEYDVGSDYHACKLTLVLILLDLLRELYI